MKIKVNKASGPVLDWMVAKCEARLPASYDDWKQTWPRYSTDWAQGGHFIERERLAISYDAEWVYDPANVDPDDEPDNGDRWYAEIRNGSHDFIGDYGPTPLIAAMRCYCCSKLGNEVEVPDELV